MKSSKLIKIYSFLIRLSPVLRLILVRWIYNKFATHNHSGKYIFLNYGYHDDTPLALNPEDEPNRLFIQLYQRAVQDIDLHDKDIAEVGCGQGAGGVFLFQYHKPRSYVGIDLSEKAIACCQRDNQYANMHWLQGSSDRLPIPDESVDVVINIESSHLYPSMKQFLIEVKRILRPNGYLAFADLRDDLQINALDQCLTDANLKTIHRSDITLQVLHSLTRLSDRRNAHIYSTYARIWRNAVQEISAVKESFNYNGFINGQKKYLCYLLQKQ